MINFTRFRLSILLSSICISFICANPAHSEPINLPDIWTLADIDHESDYYALSKIIPVNNCSFFAIGQTFDWDGMLPISVYSASDIFVSKYDNEGGEIWSLFLGSNSEDRLSSGCVDSIGNVTLSGVALSDPINLSGLDAPIEPVATVEELLDTFQFNSFLVKYSSEGEHLWSLGSLQNDDSGAWYSGHACDSQGNIYLVGLARPRIDLNGDGDFLDTYETVERPSNDWEPFVARYDSNGQFRWIKRNEIFGEAWRATVGIDGEDNVLLRTPSGAVKISSSGDTLWHRSLEGTSWLQSGLGIDLFGHVYIFGRVAGPSDLNGDGDRDDSFEQEETTGTFISKFDSNGNFRWSRRMNAYGTGFKVDSNGNAYMALEVETSAPTDLNGDGDTDDDYESSSVRGDHFLLRFTSTGKARWITYLNSLGATGGSPVRVDDEGSLLAIISYGDEGADAQPIPFPSKDDTRIITFDTEINEDEADSDGDGVEDVFDVCPADPQKIVPEDCGCHQPDLDLNNDGVTDCLAETELYETPTPVDTSKTIPTRAPTAAPTPESTSLSTSNKNPEFGPIAQHGPKVKKKRVKCRKKKTKKARRRCMTKRKKRRKSR